MFDEYSICPALASCLSAYKGVRAGQYNLLTIFVAGGTWTCSSFIDFVRSVAVWSQCCSRVKTVCCLSLLSSFLKPVNATNALLPRQTKYDETIVRTRHDHNNSPSTKTHRSGRGCLVFIALNYLDIQWNKLHSFLLFLTIWAQKARVRARVSFLALLDKKHVARQPLVLQVTCVIGAPRTTADPRHWHDIPDLQLHESFNS